MAALFGERVDILAGWIRSNSTALQKFESELAQGRSIERYLSEFAYIPDILENLANRLSAPSALLQRLRTPTPD